MTRLLYQLQDEKMNEKIFTEYDECKVNAVQWRKEWINDK